MFSKLSTNRRKLNKQGQSDKKWTETVIRQLLQKNPLNQINSDPKCCGAFQRKLELFDYKIYFPCLIISN
jgi:mRNA-degrading endonuclease YafQ of YafQ-DinJ toxin-antitoxin module